MNSFGARPPAVASPARCARRPANARTCSAACRPSAYTPAELSFAALKGANAAAAGVLAAAACDAACDLQVALMRIEESGAPPSTAVTPVLFHSRRYHEDDDEEEGDEDESGFTVAEVFDRSLTLSHWSRPDGVPVSLGTMPFTDGEVCPGDALADIDPDERRCSPAGPYKRRAMVRKGGALKP